VAIVSEVEFIPLYLDQPLFGDVCNFLTDQSLMFHKFLGMAGRPLKPVSFGYSPSHPTQQMWSDAVFIRDIARLNDLPSSKLLKMGLIAFIYGSPDVTFQCLKAYDSKNRSCLHQGFFKLWSSEKF
jgi:hypothetical protein